VIFSQFDIFSFFLYLFLFWFFFWGIAKLLKLEKRGWEVGPAWFMAKTTRLNRFINKLANRFPRFWRIFWTIGIGFGFVIMGLGMVWLGFNLFALLTAPQPENALVPFIPGVTVTGPDLLYMILPIAIIMFTHELAHGIAARLEGIKVKSSGFLAILVLIGAFVEVDEEQLAQEKRLTRQRIVAAGSFINLIIAFFALLIMVNMYGIGEGAHLVHVYEDGPAYGKLSPNEIILEINGTSVNYYNLSAALDPYKPFDPVLFTVRLENGTLLNQTIIAGFNRHKLNETPWNTLELYNGSHNTGSLDSLNESDQVFLSLNSTNSYLNFSLILNISALNISLDKIIGLAVDINLNASIDEFNTAQVLLINFSDSKKNFEFFTLQNLSSGVELTSNISKAAGYNLTNYFNSSFCLNLNFLFNSTTDFSISLDLCRIYVIENNTESYFGIGYQPNYFDRELALIFGPLTPHVYRTLLYLYIFSFAVAIFNLLPIPPFDGDHLFVSLFEPPTPPSKSSHSENNEDDSKKEASKPKAPWTWRKTVIWTVRGIAIFLFLSNIILSLVLFNVFTLFSSIF